MFLTVIATIGVLVGTVGPAHAAGPIRYVALGDSRAAGPSLTSAFDLDGCDRSGGGYPERVAHVLHPASFTDVACGGATTADVVDGPQTTDLPIIRTVAVQSRALRPDTTLVTLSIGGNDIKWGSLISPCFSLLPQVDSNCRSNTSLQQLISARLANLSGSLDHVLSVIRQHSPVATVFVVGHGGYYGLHGCYPDAGMSTPDALFVHDFFGRFNAVLADAAHRHGASFVDVAGPSVGHDACAPDSRRWFSGQLPRGNNQPNHPYQAGDAAIARVVLAAVQH